jgi:hypothetical protein
MDDQTQQESVTTAPRRRRLQFRLLLVMLLVTLCSSLLAWRSAINERKRIERQAQVIDLETRLKWIERNKWRHPGPSTEERISKLRRQIEDLQR